MSKSTNQHGDNWNPPNRFLKYATKAKRRAAERQFLHKVKEDVNYCYNNDVPECEEIEDIWNWD